MKISLGTRSAKVSLVYAKSVAKLLSAAGAEVKIVPVACVGDSIDVGLAGHGGVEIFTRELDEALKKGQLDVAVHDMCHVAPLLPANVSIAAVPARLDPREAFVSNKAKKLSALPKGARIGASGSTRAPQLAHMGKEFEVVPVISDPEAGLRALSEQVVDAVIMSCAELARLGVRNVINEPLDVGQMIPAVGQGALAVEVASDRRELIRLVTGACHHAASGVTIKAERAFLKAVSQYSEIVFAAHAEVVPAGLEMAGFVSRPDGLGYASGRENGKVEEAAELGKRLAERLVESFG